MTYTLRNPMCGVVTPLGGLAPPSLVPPSVFFYLINKINTKLPTSSLSLSSIPHMTQHILCSISQFNLPFF